MFADTATDWSMYVLVRFWQSAVFRFTYMYIFSYYSLMSHFIEVPCKTVSASNFQWLKQNIKWKETKVEKSSSKEKVYAVVWISITV